jgi:hypothetical protein
MLIWFGFSGLHLWFVPSHTRQDERPVGGRCAAITHTIKPPHLHCTAQQATTD